MHREVQINAEWIYMHQTMVDCNKISEQSRGQRKAWDRVKDKANGG